MVEGAYLGVNHRHGYVGQVGAQPVESPVKLGVDVLHVGELRLGVRNDGLQRGVLEERQEAAAYLRVVDFSQAEHVLNERARFDGVIHVHLLQRREVTGSEILAFKAVVAAHL